MFANQLIVITGGSSGVGKALAQKLSAKGANLALIARDPKKLSLARDELLRLASTGRRVEVFSCDVSDPGAVSKSFAQIAEQMGPPDVLINSAGILKEGYFEKLPLEVFRSIMDINFFGTLHCIQSALPYFKQKAEGRIVNICSSGGLMSAFGYSAYCSSKFAVTGLTNTLREELKPENIKIHLACPAEFGSPMVDELNTYRTLENRTVVQTIPVLTAERVAEEIIKGIEADRYLIIPGRVSRVLERVYRWFPSVGRAVVDYRIRKVYRGPGKS